ncbi:MAG: hypothetical protein E7316_05735 [Clostridiales bacterium]|nr:hypothetical protein [Clostridiales bacterium]
MNKKTLLALVLAVAMLLSSCALIEKDPEADRATPIIHVGETVYTKGEIQDQINYQLSYMSYVYSLYGMPFDATDPEMIASAQQQVIDYLIEEAVLNQKAAQLGLTNLTEDEQAALDQRIEDSWNTNVESVKNGYFAESELAGEELDTAIAAKCDELGLTRDLVSETETVSFMQEKLHNYVIGSVAVTDEELQAAYDAGVASDKETFAEVPDAFGTRTNNASATIYYRPAGYRMVKQILVMFTQEDQALITQVQSRIDQQKQAVTNAVATLTDLGVADAEPLLNQVSISVPQPAMAVSFGDGETRLTKPVNTKAPELDITASFDESVDETTASAVKALAEAKALQAFFESQLTTATDNAFINIDAKADEILAQLEAGADWDALMAEKTDDPGMQEGAHTAATGYAVREGYAIMDEAFVNAAMALKNVGDVSPKARGMYGYYIIQYAAEVPEGPVPLEELSETITAELLATKQQAAYDEAVAVWIAEANAQVDYEALK